MRRAGRVAAAAIIVLVARSGVARAQATLSGTPAEPSAVEEKWPLEAVRRPLTLPAMMSAFGVRPDRLAIAVPGTGTIPYSSSATLGFSLAFGLTDRLQAAIGVPRLLCMETDSPSGCTAVSRYSDAGATVRVLALRGDRLQVAPLVRVSVSQTRPDAMARWWAGASAKLSVSSVALLFSPIVTRNFGTTAAQPTNLWLAYLPIGLSVQLTQRLLVNGAVQPWGSIGDLEQGIALQFQGGVGYTFGRSGEVDLAGGVYNVLERPGWYRSLGGSYVQLSVTFWRY
jgi:hypothetical protein